MRLTRVTVRNLLSFAEQELELNPGLVVIVGPNGAGKSNLVRLLALAGLALEWLEERSSGMPQPGRVHQAQSALASFAAGRHRGMPDGARLRLEVGLQLDRAELDDLACFVRAAIVSSALSRQHNGQETIEAWAEEQITSESLEALAHGALVVEHQGATDAPWSVSYEFTVDGTRFAWGLASPDGSQVIRPVGEHTPSSPARSYEPVWTALVGSAGDDRSGQALPPLPRFSVGLLCRKVGTPAEAPLVQPPGASFSPDLEPHRRFAELAGIPVWTQPTNRVYSLA